MLLLPIAVEPDVSTVFFVPIAIVFSSFAFDSVPNEIASFPLVSAERPIAVPFVAFPVTLAAQPIAVPLSAVDSTSARRPRASAPVLCAFASPPAANAAVPFDSD